MAREMVIRPDRCTGCCTCALTCAVTYLGEFDLTRACIRITRHEFEGTFDITFSSTCRNCKQCALACPSGALRAVEIPEGEKEGG
ncbi:MAG TPA: 4Fe-4S binding protein [Desulfotomaculum sp.]|nr:4Fe-4S binding protein [Desulfofundulus thermobenzoicus]HHW43776.1 4Fe-4S binding protein [Desulfotomaculum sp.]